MAVRVLLVEDNDVLQQVGSEMLRRLGCAVEVAANGREAVERADATAYDLVFMDCHMPVMDGYEATAEPSASPSHAPLRTSIPSSVTSREAIVTSPVATPSSARSMAASFSAASCSAS